MDVKTDFALKKMQHSIPLDVLDDLCSRFIINVPDVAKQNLVRICFQIELAHWFYLDFYCTDENTKLKSCSMNEFAAHIFQHIPFLHPHAENVQAVLEEWRGYKQSVPTYGAILLSVDLSQVLLVRSYWAKTSWGFPKGKVNEDEDPAHCAIREVLEETGFDISELMDRNEYVESVINDQHVRLYLVSGIDTNTVFEPRTRCEIKCCEWFAIADLPSNKKDVASKIKTGVGPNAFFMVLPFVKRLKRWIQERSRYSVQSSRNRNKSISIADAENGSKSKQPKAPTSQQNKKEKDEDVKNGTMSVAPRSGKKQDKKPNFKRQLFNIEQEFSAPSWLSFKFDRKAILNCCP